ncbi:MAG: DUF2785 domain-containing protein [Propionibacteriaceae bacterium]
MLELICSPDAQIRERVGYSYLVRWGRSPELTPSSAHFLGDSLASWFTTDTPIQGRCYAPLGLGWLTYAGIHEDKWTESFAEWWTRETDTIGLHPELGWLHCVAHGADYVEELAKKSLFSPQLLLDWCGQRMTCESVKTYSEPPYNGVWAAQEDTRLAVALRGILLSEDIAFEAWLDKLGDVIKFPQPAPIPIAHSNSVRTLRALACGILGSPDSTETQRKHVSHLLPVLTLPI